MNHCAENKEENRQESKQDASELSAIFSESHLEEDVGLLDNLNSLSFAADRLGNNSEGFVVDDRYLEEPVQVEGDVNEQRQNMQWLREHSASYAQLERDMHLVDSSVRVEEDGHNEGFFHTWTATDEDGIVDLRGYTEQQESASSLEDEDTELDGVDADSLRSTMPRTISSETNIEGDLSVTPGVNSSGLPINLSPTAPYTRIWESIDQPVSFRELCSAVEERARFLMCFRPSDNVDGSTSDVSSMFFFSVHCLILDSFSRPPALSLEVSCSFENNTSLNDDNDEDIDPQNENEVSMKVYGLR